MKTKFNDFLNEEKKIDMDIDDKQRKIKNIINKVGDIFTIFFSANQFHISCDGSHYTDNREIDFKLLGKVISKLSRIEKDLKESNLFDKIIKSTTIENRRIKVTFNM